MKITDIITENTQAVAEGSGGAQYKIKSIGRDSKGDYYISPSTGKKVYKSGVKRGDHENPKTGEHKSVAEAQLDEGAAGIITAFAIAGGLLLGGGVAYKDHNLAQQWMQSYEKIKQSDPEQADKIKNLVNQHRFTNFRNRATRDLTKKQIEQIITNFDAQNNRPD